MDKTHSLLERIMGPVGRSYTKRRGGVRYLDGKSLTRPTGIKGGQRLILLLIAAIAIGLGAFFIYNTVYASIREAALAEQSVAENLTRTPSIKSLPDMTSLINLSDEEVLSTLEGSDYKIYDVTTEGSVSGISVYKVPDDLTIDDAAVLYARGIDRLNAAQATRILVGSWYLSTDRTGTGSMVVRYADFSTGDVQAAIQSAMATQPFDPETVSDTGVDDSGNTYASGRIDVDGVPCVWRISVLPLSDMYSVTNLPEDSCYVGIRITKQLTD